MWYDKNIISAAGEAEWDSPWYDADRVREKAEELESEAKPRNRNQETETKKTSNTKIKTNTKNKEVDFMRNKTLWKGFSAAMAVMTSVCSVSAADFTDGTLYETVAEANEATEATEADEVKENGKIEDTGNAEEAEDAGFAELTDSSGLFDDGTQPYIETPELTDSNITSAFSYDPTPGDYQASITGKLYLSKTEEFVRLINIERKKLGLGEVKIDQEMMDITSRRAVEAGVYFDHRSPNGSYSFGNAGEVLTVGDILGPVKGAVGTWKNSPGHWKILMKPEIDRIGFALYEQEGYSGGSCVIANVGYSNATSPFQPYKGDYKDKIVTYNVDISSKLVAPLRGETRNVNKDYTIPEKAKVSLAPILGALGGEYLSYVSYADNCSGTWESTNPSVASVDSNGLVTAVSKGTADIRFYFNGSRERYYSRTIHVKKQNEMEKPGTPRLKGGMNKQTCVWLDWTDVANGDGYQVYCYDTNKKKYVMAKEYPPTGLYNFSEDCGYGKTAKYKVRAFTNFGGGAGRTYGDFSNVITVKTASPETKISKLTAGKGSVSLTWKKAAGAEYYQIYRAASKNGTYSKIKTVKGNVLTYKNTGLKKGKSYYYKVRAYRVGTDGKKIYSKFSPAVGKKTK